MMGPVTSDPTGHLPVNAGFAERLLEVIDSGRRIATYKLAVLLALLDLCATGQRQRQARERAEAGEMWQEPGLVFTTSVGTAYESHNLRRDFGG